MIISDHDVSSGLLLAIAISECISIYYIFKIWSSRDYLIMKILVSGVVAIPFLGPIVYHWACTTPPPLSEAEIKNKFMPRGDFARGWLGGGRASLEKRILDLEKDIENKSEKSE